MDYHGMIMSRLATLALLLIQLIFIPSATADELKQGSLAPDFNLLDQYSKVHQLKDYKGRWLVLYFYPKADTPGCTTEACEFRDDVFQFRKMNVALLGVSTDDVKSQKEFSDKYHLPFSLLSDPDGATASKYGSFKRIGSMRFASRHTFIIDPEGKIARVYRNVSPKKHSDEIIADLKTLGAENSQRAGQI